jgi:hypothetical protein
MDAGITEVLTETPGIPKMDCVKAVGGNRKAVSDRIDFLIDRDCIKVTFGGEKGTAKLLSLGADIPSPEAIKKSFEKLIGKSNVVEMEVA